MGQFKIVSAIQQLQRTSLAGDPVLGAGEQQGTPWACAQTLWITHQ